MDLSIIIVNYKTGGLVKQSLINLEKGALAMSYEIIVLDNDSGDGCITMIHEQFDDVVTIQSDRNKGFGEGNNEAVRHAKGSVLLFLNADVAAKTDAINELYRFLTGTNDAAIAAPRLLNPDGSVQLSCLRFPEKLTPLYSRTFLKHVPLLRKRLETYRMKEFDHATTRTVPWVLGACMMIKRNDFENAQGFDKRYFMYFEDTDLCRTLWSSNRKVYYHPKAEMVHYYQRQSADVGIIKNFLNKTFYYHLASWYKYVKKYAGSKPPSITNLIDNA